jgi:hypothetical protein
MHLETLSKSSRYYKLCERRLIISSKCEYTKVTKSVTDKAEYEQRHLHTDLYGQTYRVYICLKLKEIRPTPTHTDTHTHTPQTPVREQCAHVNSCD